jgi:hypothetical protein
MKSKPVKHLRAWPLSVAIWRNIGDDKRAWYSVTMERSYKSDSGYESTASLNKDDLLLAAKLIDRAHSEILNMERADHAARKAAGEAPAPGAASTDVDDVPF